jgi:hypothetical protein
LEVTQEQKEAIYHFFAHNDWEFKEVQIPSNNDQSRDDLIDKSTTIKIYIYHSHM